MAPLRIARGVQNKVLEAMAMARPVVATPQAAEGIRAEAGRDFHLARDEAGFAGSVVEQLRARASNGAARASNCRYWAHPMRSSSATTDTPARCACWPATTRR